MRLRLSQVLLLWLVGISSLSAQNLLTSPRGAVEGQVYRLSEAQARQFAMGRLSQPTDDCFTDLVAAYPAAKPAQEDLAPGHYLMSHVVGNQVEWTYRQVPGFSVMVENDGLHLMVKAIDFGGKQVEDAQVMLGETLILYDPATHAYKAATKESGGLLEVRMAGMVQYYHLARTVELPARKNSPAWKRWMWRPVFRWVVRPVMWTVKLPYDMVRSVVKQRLYGWPAWVTYRSIWLYRKVRHIVERKRPVQFMLCSQPRYRPGDTVKVKAYITDRQGHPLRRTLQLLFTDRHQKTRILAHVRPVQPGCYVSQFVLHDSLELQLDRPVGLILHEDRKWKGQPVPQEGTLYWNSAGKPRAQATFLYEDYELNQVTFSLRAEHVQHWQDKPAVLFLEAKDMNGLTVPDARATLTVVSDQVQGWRKDHDFLPDTLWKWEGLLDPSGETRLEVPRERFPQAEFGYTVKAECRTSDNERKTATARLTYLHDSDWIQVQRHGDSIHISLRRAGEPIPAAAALTFHLREASARPHKAWLQLPAKMAWPANYASMTIETEKATLAWSPGGGSNLRVYGHHAGDSLHILAQATDSATFTYHLLEGQREVATGCTARLDLHRGARRGSTYHLAIHRIVEGSSITHHYTYHWRKRDLQVDWTGPSTIYPGMTADLQVQVHTPRGKPVRKADITAYAINSRFEGYAPPNLPSASKPAKPRKKQDNWQSSPASAWRTGKFPLDYATWAGRVGLDTLPWYQFLYPDSGLYTSLHPIDSGMAEVAPFVVRKGVLQPVQIVYIDAEPVYFAWASPEVPYSFSIKPGRHRIEMRLPDYGVKIDTFTLLPGYKTILSVDPDHLPRQVLGKEMTSTPLPPEKDIIQRYTIAYRGVASGKPSFLRTGDRILRLDAAGTHLHGPVVRPHMSIEVTDTYTHDLQHEQGFEYEFGPKVIKMRTFDPAHYPQWLNYHPQQAVEHRPWVRDSILAQWRRSRLSSPSVRNWQPSSNSHYTGRLFTDLTVKGIPYTAIPYLALHDDSKNVMYVIPHARNAEMRVPIGKWGVSLLLTEDRFVNIDSIEVLPFGRNFYRMVVDASQVEKAFSEQHPQSVSHWKPEVAERPRERLEIFTATRLTSGQKVRIYGRVYDAQTAEAMPFATIVCKGFGVGVHTAEDGSFAMDVPVETDTLVVSYIGFKRREVMWRGEQRLDIGMEEESIVLSEVQVMGTRHHVELQATFSSHAVMDAKAITSLPGMRGVSDLITITGGVPAAYGDVTGGVLSMVPDFPEELLAALEGQSVVRKDFRDHAVWEPSLRSNRKGTATFRVRFPEDITRWDAYALAVDRRGRTGGTRSFIRAWKPLAGRLAMPRFLYQGDTAYVIGKVLNYTGDTLDMRRTFQQGGQVLAQHTGACGPFLLDTLAVAPTATADSFTLSYLASKADGDGDGEQWGVRVFRKGISQSDGLFSSLVGDTLLQLPSFDPDHGDIHLRASSKLQGLLLTESQRLGNYEHLCNEQLASKLMALLAERQIFLSLGREWKGEPDVKRVLNLFSQRLKPAEPGWGWWPGMQVEVWVSTHVIRALTWAKRMGYPVDITYLTWSPRLLAQLDSRLPSHNLALLQLIQDIDSTLDIRAHIQALDTIQDWNLGQQVAKMELRQRAGLAIDLDSLWRLSSRDIYGQRHWAYASPRYSFTEGNLPATLAAYRILRRSGESTARLIPIVYYLLQQRTSTGWGNTYLTAQVLSTLIADVGLETIQGTSRLTLLVNGQPRDIPLDSTITLPPGASLQVQKSNPGIAFFSAYQQWFDAAPQRIDSLFAITTGFSDRFRSVAHLKAGEPVTLHVDVDVKRDAEYLMLEVPIPASCSYTRKGGYYDSHQGTYREHFRQKTVFYFRALPRGHCHFTIDLLPRYTGTYTLNAARMEHMYFPVLAGQNEIRQVGVQ